MFKLLDGSDKPVKWDRAAIKKAVLGDTGFVELADEGITISYFHGGNRDDDEIDVYDGIHQTVYDVVDAELESAISEFMDLCARVKA